MARLTVKIETDLGPIKDLLEDINAMQTYKLFENDDMILIDKADLCDILVRHVRARRADESPETAADVRPVVLCRDCKHSAIDLENMRYCKCVTYYNHVPDDWFCADGEKREES